jgi:hypothetical protein
MQTLRGDYGQPGTRPECGDERLSGGEFSHRVIRPRRAALIQSSAAGKFQPDDECEWEYSDGHQLDTFLSPAPHSDLNDVRFVQTVSSAS